MTNNQSKNKDLIVGLDIGTSKVVCLVGRYDSSDNLEILSLGTYPSSGLKKRCRCKYRCNNRCNRESC